MKPPTKNLIGGVEELHTREYLFKISAQMIGCRERSKNHLQEQQERKNKCRTRVFGEKERGRKKTYLKGGLVGPRRPVGAARGQAAPAGRLDQGWAPCLAPGAPTSLIWWKFYYSFSGIFLTNSLLKKYIEVQKAAKLPEKLEIMVKHTKLQKHKTLVQLGGWKIKEIKT